jgi:protein-tyrosine phosphatase
MYPPNGIRGNSHSVSAAQVDQQKSIKGRIWTKMVNLKDTFIALVGLIAKRIFWFGSLVGTVLENMLPSKKWSHEILTFTTKEKNPDLFENPVEKKHTLTLGGMPAFRTAKDDTQYISMLEPYERKFILKEVLDKTSFHKTPDFVKVPADKIQEAVKKVRDELQKGNVYLHCKAGYGRSAVVAVCYMMSVLKDDEDQDGEFKYRVNRKTMDSSNVDFNRVYDTEKLYKAAYDYVKERRPQIYTKTRDEEAKEWFRIHENEYTLD